MRKPLTKTMEDYGVELEERITALVDAVGRVEIEMMHQYASLLSQQRYDDARNLAEMMRDFVVAIPRITKSNNYMSANAYNRLAMDAARLETAQRASAIPQPVTDDPNSGESGKK